MKRRSFFAALFAPLVARWMPKAKAGTGIVREQLPSLENLKLPDFVLQGSADTISLDEYARSWIDPQLRIVANDLDRQVANFIALTPQLKIGDVYTIRKPQRLVGHEGILAECPPLPPLSRLDLLYGTTPQAPEYAERWTEDGIFWQTRTKSGFIPH